jgi:8-oxo-dGTP pyrophosphatase MutT (NUDIX family)
MTAVPKFDKFKKYFGKKNQIQEIVREPTSGGVIFRHSKDGLNDIEILLIQDSRDRWTIPKGHIEEDEPAEVTAAREIMEETGIGGELEIIDWLGKINFRYRRENSLVLMTTQIFLVRSSGEGNDILLAEDWINGVKWFKFNEALEAIEYDDIGKLMLLAMKKIRQEKL